MTREQMYFILKVASSMTSKQQERLATKLAKLDWDRVTEEDLENIVVKIIN